MSVSPYTYSDEFVGDGAVLSRDNLKISFAVHTVWRVDEHRVPLFMERYSTTVTNGSHETSPDAIVKTAYGHFVREPLRTFARDEVQRRDGLVVKDELIRIGDGVLARIRDYAKDSPFVVTSVVVGNVQYPSEVADAVSRKLAATQELARKDTEIEAIEAQKLMVNSPNHTTVYIPVGPMGVPLTGTFPAPAAPTPPPRGTR